MAKGRDYEALSRSHDSTSRALETERARMEAVRKAVERLYEPHSKPFPDDVRLGNGLPKRWWCDGCRTQWPCKTFLELRRLYSITYGGDPDRPLPELRLDLVSNKTIPL